MFVNPVRPMFTFLVPQTDSLIPLIRKNISNPKSFKQYKRIDLILSHLHILKIMRLANNFTCHVRMMQMYFNVNNFMDTFKEIYCH